jgi:hypothetical protein
MGEAPAYTVTCHSCSGSFDALEATWCSCLVSERSLVCQSCLTSVYTNMKYQTEGFKRFKVDDYLAKPLDFAKLQALFQKHLG